MFSFSISTALDFLGVCAFETLSVDFSFSARRRFDNVVLLLSYYYCSVFVLSGGNGSTNSCCFWLVYLGSFWAGGIGALLICCWSFLFFSISWGDYCESASLSFWSFLFAVLLGLFDVDSLLVWLLLLSALDFFKFFNRFDFRNSRPVFAGYCSFSLADTWPVGLLASWPATWLVVWIHSLVVMFDVPVYYELAAAEFDDCGFA